jgi:hypothetical protein
VPCRSFLSGFPYSAFFARFAGSENLTLLIFLQHNRRDFATPKEGQGHGGRETVKAKRKFACEGKFHMVQGDLHHFGNTLAWFEGRGKGGIKKAPELRL